MPKKKSISKLSKSPESRKTLSSPKSYMSLAYGALTVIFLFALVVFGIRAFTHRDGTISKEAAQTSQIQVVKNVHVVQKGESLYSIAEKKYGDGDKWVDIAKANHLENPSVIHSGNTLTMPEIAMVKVTPTVSPTPSPAIAQMQSAKTKISDNFYTVQKGDYLWNIAIRAYGNGYKWVDIARANNLSNPGLIFSGNILKIPR